MTAQLNIWGHTVDKCHAEHVVEGVDPGLDVGNCHHQILLFVVATSTAICSSFVVPKSHDLYVVIIPKPRALVAFWYEPEATQGKDDGKYSFNDVQPVL